MRDRCNGCGRFVIQTVVTCRDCRERDESKRSASQRLLARVDELLERAEREGW